MEQSIFPEIKIVNPMAVVRSIGATVKRVVELGTVTELCLTTHNTGANAMLDANLRDQANQVAN